MTYNISKYLNKLHTQILLTTAFFILAGINSAAAGVYESGTRSIEFSTSAPGETKAIFVKYCLNKNSIIGLNLGCEEATVDSSLFVKEAALYRNALSYYTRNSANLGEFLKFANRSSNVRGRARIWFHDNYFVDFHGSQQLLPRLLPRYVAKIDNIVKSHPASFNNIFGKYQKSENSNVFVDENDIDEALYELWLMYMLK